MPVPVLWLDAAVPAATLPAVWLIATAERPATLGERSRLRRATAAAILERQLGHEPAELVIGHDAGGRPLAPAGTGLHLSIAQREGLVAVAAARSEVGVDVERVDGTEPPLALLHEDEAEWIGAASGSAAAERFALIWSAKEAYVKALGTGFVRPPESFAVRLDGAGRIAITDDRARRPAGGAARLHRIADGRLFAAAVVTLA